MKKSLFLFCIILCTLSAWGAQRSSDEAFSVAQSFFNQKAGETTTRANHIYLIAVSGDLLQPATTRGTTDEPAFFIFNNDRDSYVIVSGDDRMKPILAYSDNGAFITENLPDNLLRWLEIYNDVYLNLDNTENAVAKSYLLTSSESLPIKVEPLLNGINWNQDAPYNNSCPLVNGERSVTGCVATAMAMVLKYHEYPVRGKGAHSYTSNGIQCSFDYENTTFDWENMLPQYISGQYTDAEANAVSQLMYACGVAVDMSYSPTASGAIASKVAQALIDYFNYDENLAYIYREFFTSSEWMNIIKTELANRRPILYNGASKDVGHEFVFDGYDADNMVHVNWGWGGLNNGYFEVASLDPSAPGIGGGTNMGGGYVYQQGMVVGLKSPGAASEYKSYFMLSKLGLSKSEVSKDEPFNVTITEMYNMSTLFKNGSLALIAEKDGRQEIIGNSLFLNDIKTGYGFKTYTLENAFVPSALSEGTYSVYLGTKDERETKWSRARGIAGSETQYTLVINGNHCTFRPFTGNLVLQNDLMGSVESLHNLYSGRNGSFRMTISNNSRTDEFYGLAGVMFIKADETEDIIALIGYSQLLLEPNVNDKEMIVTDRLISNLTEMSTNIPAGDYYICPGVQWGEYVYAIGNDLKKVTVNQAYGSPTLIVKDARLSKQVLHVGETLSLLATLSLSGTGNVYDKTLMAAIFKKGSGSTSNLHYAEVFVEKGEETEWTMDIDLMESEGNYHVNLYKPSLLGDYDGNDPICNIPFEIISPTGIEDQPIEKEFVITTPQPINDLIRIHVSASVRNIYVYSLTGQLLMQEQGIDATGNESEFSVGSLSTGCYIVNLQTNDGKIYTGKFMKE